MSEEEDIAYNAKLAAVKAIAEFIRDGGGTYRALLYDYLGEEDYCAFQSAGLLEICNFVYSALKDKKSED